MPQSKAVTRQRDPLPDNFDSLEEFWAFWDTHSTTDYEDLMEDVESQLWLQEEVAEAAQTQ